MNKRSGFLIAIDGSDGTGKTTQTEILTGRLKKAGFSVEVASFPQYGKKSAGLIEEYLNGKYGSADDVGPLRASMMYALDRYDASFMINRWLSEGKIVICNRYVASNMAHQGGKIADKNKRELFFKWLDKLEYNIFKIPRPDVYIILHLESELTQSLLDRKGYRGYIEGDKTRDIHEADEVHLKNAEKIYLEIAENISGQNVIRCSEYGTLFSRENISEKVWDLLMKNSSFQVLFSQIFPITEKTGDFSLKVKRLFPSAISPKRGEAGAKEIIIYSPDNIIIEGLSQVDIKTGLIIFFPEKYSGIIYRNLNFEKGIRQIIGVLQTDEEQELTIAIKNHSNSNLKIFKGEEIARIIFKNDE